VPIVADHCVTPTHMLGKTKSPNCSIWHSSPTWIVDQWLGVPIERTQQSSRWCILKSSVNTIHVCECDIKPTHNICGSLPMAHLQS
jgi:hypothetical protein